MELNTRDNGLLTNQSDREKDSKFGLMGQCMKGGGKTTRLLEKED